MYTSPIALACLVLWCACGPKLPPRYVVESDVGPYRYRRYQQVLDVEVRVPGNPAVGYTATYVRGGAKLSVTPAFVTVYERARGLTETARQRLRTMPGYALTTREFEGHYVWRVDGDGGDAWVVWVSGPHLIKLGVPTTVTDVPEELARAYLEVYPSDLDGKGRARADTTSAGEAVNPLTRPSR